MSPIKFSKNTKNFDEESKSFSKEMDGSNKNDEETTEQIMAGFDQGLNEDSLTLYPRPVE